MAHADILVYCLSGKSHLAISRNLSCPLVKTQVRSISTTKIQKQTEVYYDVK